MRKCEVCDAPLDGAKEVPAREGGRPRFVCENGHETIGYEGRAYGPGDLERALRETRRTK